MNLKQKKGLSVGDSIPIVMILATLFILIICMVYLFSTMQGTFTGLVSTTVTEESITGQNLSGAILSNNSYIKCNYVLKSIAIKNLTGTVPATNYTYTTDGRNITADTNSPYKNNPWNATYTYTDGGDACENTQTITNTTVDSIPIAGLVMTVAFIAIIITILVGVMWLRKGKDSTI